MSVNAQNKIGLTDNLFFTLESRASGRQNRIAFLGKGGKGASYTYSELFSSVRKIAAGLQKHSLLQKKEIGLLSENRPEWGIAYFSILAAGGTVVPIDANLKPNEIENIINHADLEVVFTSSNFIETLNGFDKDLKLFSFDENSHTSYKSLFVDPSGLTPSQSETAVLIYTSGTTGDPKAVELTHKNLLCNLASIEEALEVKENDVFLSILPLHHTFEATCGFFTPLYIGCKIVYARSLKSKEIIEDIVNNQITVLIGVPLLFEKMFHSINRAINNAPVTKRIMFKSLYSLSNLGWKVGNRIGVKLFQPLREKAGLGSIRMFVSGGAAVPSRIAEFFNYIGLVFIQGYGMTESSPVLSAQRPDDIKFGSVGQAVANVEIRIENPDKKGVGEIIARGGNVTPGYRNNPEKTSELLKNGWLHTGDLGCIKKGHLWITGRAKNLIVSAAGKNIYPEEIEDKLHESNMILETVVFGRKKKSKQGEEVVAIIVPDLDEVKAYHELNLNNPDMKILNNVFKEIVTNVNTQMADYKRITNFEVQINELEKTSTKKVKRFLYN